MSKEYDSVEKRYPWIKHWSVSGIVDMYSKGIDPLWDKGADKFLRLPLYKSSIGKRLGCWVMLTSPCPNPLISLYKFSRLLLSL